MCISFEALTRKGLKCKKARILNYKFIKLWDDTYSPHPCDVWTGYQSLLVFSSATYLPPYQLHEILSSSHQTLSEEPCTSKSTNPKDSSKSD